MKTDVHAILKKHLETIGADGLCNGNEECGCSRDDLCPCECSIILDCLPAKLTKDPEDGVDTYVPLEPKA